MTKLWDVLVLFLTIVVAVLLLASMASLVWVW